MLENNSLKTFPLFPGADLVFKGFFILHNDMSRSFYQKPNVRVAGTLLPGFVLTDRKVQDFRVENQFILTGLILVVYPLVSLNQMALQHYKHGQLTGSLICR